MWTLSGAGRSRHHHRLPPGDSLGASGGGRSSAAALFGAWRTGVLIEHGGVASYSPRMIEGLFMVRTLGCSIAAMQEDSAARWVPSVTAHHGGCCTEASMPVMAWFATASAFGLRSVGRRRPGFCHRGFPSSTNAVPRHPHAVACALDRSPADAVSQIRAMDGPEKVGSSGSNAAATCWRHASPRSEHRRRMGSIDATLPLGDDLSETGRYAGGEMTAISLGVEGRQICAAR